MTLVVYLAVVGIAATGIYDPLTQGRDDCWVVVIGLIGAHLALGMGVGRLWALVPAGIAAALTALSWGEPLVLFGLLFLVPTAMLITAVGLAFSRSPHAAAITAASFLTALPGAVWGLAETIDRSDAPRVSAGLERRLTGNGHLANLCPGSATPKRLRSRLEVQAETLIRELERHPDWLVPYTYYSSDGPDERAEITVRELAEEELGFYEAAGPRCEGGYQARLAALD